MQNNEEKSTDKILMDCMPKKDYIIVIIKHTNLVCIGINTFSYMMLLQLKVYLLADYVQRCAEEFILFFY